MLDTSKVREYVDQIDRYGFVEIANPVPNELVDRIVKLIERPLNRPTINGMRGYVQSGNTRFLHQTLAWGRDIIDLYTHPAIIELAEKYAEDEVHLSNYRIYRAFPSRTEKMPWHVDNKIDRYDEKKDAFVTTMMPQDKGIILIMYLSDVEDGGFQIVTGSHKWAYEQEVWDDNESQFADKIVTFNNRPRGTAIFYDYRCIHRAKPYLAGGIRTSAFAQYSPSRMPVGEPIFLCARDLPGLSEVQKRVLNFGSTPSTENWPIGSPSEILDQLGMSLTNSVRFGSRVSTKIKLGLNRWLSNP